MSNTQDLGKYIPQVRAAGIRLNANEPLVVASTATFSGTVNFTGSTNLTGAETITSTSANAFAAGANGTTNPQFNVDASTASVVTGLNVKGAAAAGGLALSTLSSGTNENLTIDAKGSGTVTINGTATGIVVLPAGTTIGGSVPLTSTITSSSANALTVGPNGTTNPAFNIDASTASAATGLNIKSAAAGSGIALSVISSGTNETISISGKGTGGINLGSSGNTGAIVLTTASNPGISMGPNGATNPTLQLRTDTGSAATGVKIQSAAAGSGIAVSTISSGTNENMTISAKGTGSVTINSGTALTAGGSAGAGILISSVGQLGFYAGTGAPTFTAYNGSVYVNTTATTTTTRIYVNNSGSGTAGTTWTNLTTAA